MSSGGVLPGDRPQRRFAITSGTIDLVGIVSALQARLYGEFRRIADEQGITEQSLPGTPPRRR